MNMLTGAFAQDSGKAMTIQVGANADQSKSIFIGTMSATALGLQSETAQGKQSISLAAPDQANLAIATLDSALNKITKQRSDLGAYQNRFEMAYKGVAVAAENMTASESRIRDVDMATQMVSYTKNNILSQAGTAMLAQANVSTRSVTQLLG
jgi:flagellin